MALPDSPTSDPIIEGILTTLNDRGETHLSAFGPRVSPDWSRMLLRPFVETTVWKNLHRTARAIFHVTDDAGLIARLAIGDAVHPQLAPTLDGYPDALVDHCGWYALEVTEVDWSTPRASLACRVTNRAQGRVFIGFQRARHAILELAIVCTRLAHLPESQIHNRLAELLPLVEKTGGPSEHQAFRLLCDYIEQQLPLLRSVGH